MPDAAPEVGLPVRLELDDGADDHATRERPVHVVGVQPVDDVPDAHGHAPLQARHEMHDTQFGEGVARLRHGRWLEIGAGQLGDVVKGQHQGYITFRSGRSRNGTRLAEALGCG